MPDIRTQQGIGIDDRSTQEPKANVIVLSHSQLNAKGTLRAEHGSRARHVGTDRDRPETKLIVRQQVSGKRKQQGQDQQHHANAPVKLAWSFVRAGQHHSKHVQPGGDYHQVRRPAVHVSQ